MKKTEVFSMFFFGFIGTYYTTSTANHTAPPHPHTTTTLSIAFCSWLRWSSFHKGCPSRTNHATNSTAANPDTKTKTSTNTINAITAAPSAAICSSPIHPSPITATIANAGTHFHTFQIWKTKMQTMMNCATAAWSMNCSPVIPRHLPKPSHPPIARQKDIMNWYKVRSMKFLSFHADQSPHAHI